MHGAEAEPRDCKPHTAPFANPTRSVRAGRGVALFQPDFPHFGLTKQSLMNGC